VFVRDPEGTQARGPARKDGTSLFVERRLDAAARERAGDVPPLRDRENRAGLARRGALGPDERRRGDALALSRPALEGVEKVPHSRRAYARPRARRAGAATPPTRRTPPRRRDRR